jgi:hypothetical protein
VLIGGASFEKSGNSWRGQRARVRVERDSLNPHIWLGSHGSPILNPVISGFRRSDGPSENTLYVIDTDADFTKVRRSHPKGFVNVSRVRWPADCQKSSFRKNKGLNGVEVVFGKGHWKPADEFLGYCYGSLSRRVLLFSTVVQPIRLCTILAIANSTSLITGIV